MRGRDRSGISERMRRQFGDGPSDRENRFVGVISSLIGGGLVVLAVFVPAANYIRFLLAVGTAVSALAVLGIFVQYRRSSSRQNFFDAREDLIGGPTEFSMLLRPFGEDGEVVVYDPPGGRIAQILVRVLLFRPFLFANYTLEQVVSRRMRRHFGCDTVALVDQKKSVAPPGPLYLRTSDVDWQGTIEDLLRRALFVVILLPPGGDIRQPLEWELGRVVGLGLHARTLVLTVPDKVARKRDRTTIEKLSYVAARLSVRGSDPDLPEGSLATWIEPDVATRIDSGSVFRWIQLEDYKSIEPGKIQLTTGNYDAIFEGFAASQSYVASLSFAEKYPYVRSL